MVVLLGALMMHGFLPGPLLIKEAPQLLYASVAGLLGGTLMLALVGWFIARALLKLVTFDRSLVLIGALGMTMVGGFSIERSVFDVGLLDFFGTIGYFMLRYGYSHGRRGDRLRARRRPGDQSALRPAAVRRRRLGLRLAPLDRDDPLASLALLVFGTLSTLKLARREARLRKLALKHICAKARIELRILMSSYRTVCRAAASGPA